MGRQDPLQVSLARSYDARFAVTMEQCFLDVVPDGNRLQHWQDKFANPDERQAYYIGRLGHLYIAIMAVGIHEKADQEIVIAHSKHIDHVPEVVTRAHVLHQQRYPLPVAVPVAAL